METLVGRVTKNAQVKTTKSEKKVVNFSIAVNDHYKPKDGEAKKIVRYFNCAYWMGTGVADLLTKGALVELNGRIGADSFMGSEGNPITSLTMHVTNIKLHGSAGTKTGKASAATPAEPADDLPF